MTATLNTTIIQNASSSTPNITLDTVGNAAFGGMPYGASSFKRNRIINGNILIDQRNNGASVTASTTGSDVYTVDRWSYYTTQASKFTVQQNAGSVTPPAGFTKYLGFTSSSSYTSASTDLLVGFQWIEGYNVADLNFGTANAKTITVSFWAYSSLIGTFAGSVIGTNGSAFRSYVFTFSLASANTWTYVSVTIPGDTTTFSYNTTNGQGLALCFNLGCGSNYQTTAGSWTSSNYYSTSSAQNITATSGATFYVTGVQLEVGSVATPYEFSQYSDQLSQCLRYYRQTDGASVAYGEGSIYCLLGAATQAAGQSIPYPVPMRTNPTAAFAGTWATVNATSKLITAYPNCYFPYVIAAAAGQTAMYTNSSGYLTFNAEL